MAGGLTEEPRPVLNGAALFILCSIVEAADAGEGNGTSAHGAGLQRDIQVAIRKPLGPELLASRSNDLHLGMGRGVAQFQRPVSVSRQNLTILYQNRADGHFTPSGCQPCFFKGQIHESLAELVRFVRHEN